MSFRLPGLSCVDQFVFELSRRLPDEAVRLIGLPPGYDTHLCFERLARAAGAEGTYRFEYPYASQDAVEGAAQTLRAIADMLRLKPETATSAEDLVLHNVAALRQPKTLGLALAGGLEAAAVSAVLQVCRDLAEFTKDLQGKLNFLLLMPGGVHAQGAEQILSWHPLTPQLDLLPFEDMLSGLDMTASRLEQRGFEIYLSLRIYWEAAGAPQAISKLQQVHDFRAFWVSSEDADARINGRFDALQTEAEGRAGALAALFLETVPEDMVRGILSTGVLQPESRGIMIRWLTAGLAWRPPNSLHLRVTPGSALALARSPDFIERWQISAEALGCFRLSCRMNPLVSAWVMSLCGLVEMEMLHFCKQVPKLNELLEQCGHLDALVALHEKAPSRQASINAPIDYASFGDLQHIIFTTSLGEAFPLSRERVDQIRRTRNLAAHRHPIDWYSVRILLQALAALHANERRFRTRCATLTRHDPAHHPSI